MSIEEAFDDTTIERLATPNSLSRGRRYAQEGRVKLRTVDNDRVAAEVRGSATYRVELRASGSGTRAGMTGASSWSCSCPVGAPPQLCKHAVAVALTARWANSTSADQPEPSPTQAALEAFLSTTDRAVLEDLVREQVQIDERFAVKLEAMAQLAGGDELDVKEWKKKVTKAFGRGHVDYYRAPDWAAGVNQMLDTLFDLLDAGHFEAAATLAEHAFHRAETAVGRVDDSDGWISGISNRIRDLHAAACREAGLKPKALAKRLVKLELNADLDTFHRSALLHADALGPEGLEEYGRLVRAVDDQLPAEGGRFGPRFRVRHALIGHALATNDPDRLIEVMADDLVTPADYLEIIEALHRAGRIIEALEWSTRGLHETGDRTFQLPPLRAKHAELLRLLGDDGEAESIYRQAFESRPNATTFGDYVDNAVDPDAAADAAVEHVLARLGEPSPALIGREVATPETYGIVGVLLAADRTEQAWTTALTHGATANEWAELGRLREADHPDAAVAVAMLAVEAQIERRGKGSYRQAAAELDRIARIAERAGQPDLHTNALADVIERHRNKPSLMAILGQ